MATNIFDLATKYDSYDAGQNKLGITGYDVNDIRPEDLLKNAKVLSDIRRLYEKRGKTFSSDEEMVAKWYRDKSWSITNIATPSFLSGGGTGGAIEEAIDVQTDDDETKELKNRLDGVFERMPWPGQPGGMDWWNWTRGYIGGAVLDPVNIIPYSLALKAMRGAALVGKVSKGFKGTVLSEPGKRAMAKGAKWEGGIGAGAMGAYDLSHQVRSIELDQQEGLKGWELAAWVAGGGALGGALGTAIAGGAAWFTGSRGLRGISSLREAGWGDGDIAKLSQKEFKQAIKAVRTGGTGAVPPRVSDVKEFETIPMDLPIRTADSERPVMAMPGKEEAAEVGPEAMLELATGRRPTEPLTTGVPGRSEIPKHFDIVKELLKEKRSEIADTLESYRAASDVDIEDEAHPLFDQIKELLLEDARLRNLQGVPEKIAAEQPEIDDLLGSNVPNKVREGKLRSEKNAAIKADYDAYVENYIRTDRLDTIPESFKHLVGDEADLLETRLNLKDAREEGIPAPGVKTPRDTLGLSDDELLRDAGWNDADINDLRNAGESAFSKAVQEARDKPLREPTDLIGEPTKKKGGRPPLLNDRLLVALKETGAHGGTFNTKGYPVRAERALRDLAKHFDVFEHRTRDVEELKTELIGVLRRADEERGVFIHGEEQPKGGRSSQEAVEFAHETSDDKAWTAIRDAMNYAHEDLDLGWVLGNREFMEAQIGNMGLSDEVTEIAKGILDRAFIRAEELKAAGTPSGKGLEAPVKGESKYPGLGYLPYRHIINEFDDATRRYIERETDRRYALFLERWPQLRRRAQYKEIISSGKEKDFKVSQRNYIQQQIMSAVLQGIAGPKAGKGKSQTQQALDRVEGATFGKRSREEIMDEEELAHRIMEANEQRKDSQLSRLIRASQDQSGDTTFRGEESARAAAETRGLSEPIPYIATGHEILADTKRIDHAAVEARRIREETASDPRRKEVASKLRQRADELQRRVIDIEKRATIKQKNWIYKVNDDAQGEVAVLLEDVARKKRRIGELLTTAKDLEKIRGERIWKNQYTKSGDIIYYDPITKRSYSSIDNIDMAHGGGGQVDVGGKVTPEVLRRGRVSKLNQEIYELETRVREMKQEEGFIGVGEEAYPRNELEAIRFKEHQLDIETGEISAADAERLNLREDNFANLSDADLGRLGDETFDKVAFWFEKLDLPEPAKATGTAGYRVKKKTTEVDAPRVTETDESRKTRIGGIVLREATEAQAKRAEQIAVLEKTIAAPAKTKQEKAARTRAEKSLEVLKEESFDHPMWELYRKKESGEKIGSGSGKTGLELDSFLQRQRGDLIEHFRSVSGLPPITLPKSGPYSTLYKAARKVATPEDVSKVGEQIQAGLFDTPASNLESSNKEAMEGALQNFLKTGNVQSLIDEADAVRASQGIDTSVTHPGAPKPGYRGGGSRIVALFKKGGDPTDTKDWRVISPKQIEAGLGYRALLGNAKEEDWGIFSVPKGSRARDLARDPSLAVADSPSDLSTLNAFPEGHPQAVHEPVEVWNGRTLELINETGDSPYQHIFGGTPSAMQDFKMFRQMFGDEYFTESGNAISITGEGLDSIIMRLVAGKVDRETGEVAGAWAATGQEHAFSVELLGKLLALRAEAVPSGIRRVDDDLATSVMNVLNIFNGYDDATRYVARDVLERVSSSYGAATGASGRAPLIEHNENAWWGVRVPGSDSAELNTVAIGATGMGNQRFMPDASKLVHEVFHWAWFNVLSDADKVQFLSSIKKYYTNGVLDWDKIKTHGADVDISVEKTFQTNSLSSPFELFAHMGERWAMQGLYREQIGNETFWSKIVDYVKAIFNRYVDGTTIDPEMVPLFEKILPASEADAARVARSNPAPSGPAKSTATEGMVLKHAITMNNLTRDIEEGLSGLGDPLDSAADLARFFWVMAGGRKGANAFKGGGRDRFKSARVKMRNASAAIFESMGVPPYKEGAEPSGTLLADEPGLEIAGSRETIDTGDDLIETGYARVDDHLASITGTPVWDEAIQRFAKVYKNEVAPLVEDLSERFAKSYYNSASAKTFDPNALPESIRAHLYIDNNGNFRVPGGRGGSKWKNILNAQAVRLDKEAKVVRRMEKKATEKFPEQVHEGGSVNVKDLSLPQLVELYSENSATSYGKMLANEMKHRARATPLPAKQVAVRKAVYTSSGADILNGMVAAWKAGDRDLVSEYHYEFWRRAQNRVLAKAGLPSVEPLFPPAYPHTIRIIKNEIADMGGLATQDGQYPNASSHVREMLSYFSNRNPVKQVGERTLAYRLLALMDKTRAPLGQGSFVPNTEISYNRPGLAPAQRIGADEGASNLIVEEDIARILGETPPGSRNTTFTRYGEPSFITFRGKVRGLSNAINAGGGKKSPMEAITSALELTARTRIFNDDDVNTIMQWHFDRGGREAFARFQVGTVAANRKTVLDDFARASAEHLSENTAAEIDDGVDELMTRLFEATAYLLNGQVARKDIKKQFRMLDAYGDMFEPHRPSKGYSLVEQLGHRDFISAEYADEYVGQVLASMNENSFNKMLDFVGTGIGRAGDGAVNIFWADANVVNPKTLKFGRNAKQAFPEHTRELENLITAGVSEVDGADILPFSRDHVTTAARGKAARIERVRVGGLAFDLLDSRENINQIVKSLGRLTRYNKSEAAKIKNRAEAMGLSEYELRAREIHKLEDRLTLETSREMWAYEELNQANIPIKSRGSTLTPMIVNVINPAKFGDKDMYNINSPMIRNIVENVIDSIAPERGKKTQELFSRLSEPVSGGEAYKTLVDFMGSKILRRVLRELGYDGILYSDMAYRHRRSSPHSLETSATPHESLEVFSSKQYRSLKESVISEYAPAYPHEAEIVDLPGEVTPSTTINGIWLAAAMDKEIPIAGGTHSFAPLGASMEASGAPKRLTDVLAKMLNQRKLTDADGAELHKFGAWVQLRTNSERLRLFENWIADFVSPKDETGIGFFESHHMRLAEKVHPIWRAMNELPGSGGKGKRGAAFRWMKRNYPSKNISKEEDNLVKALRREPGNSYEAKLSPGGYKLLQNIREAFKTEWNELVADGVLIGKIENYYPQIWDTSAIKGSIFHRDSEQEFVEALADYFQHESSSSIGIAEGRAPLDRSDAIARARGMMDTLLDEDGIAMSPPGGGTRDRTTDHIDFQRMIRLDKFPEMVDKLEPFMMNNVRDVLVKYFDGTTSRKMFHNKFGVKNHGYYAYRQILANPRHADGEIAQLLSSDSFKMRQVKGAVGRDGPPIADFKEEIIHAPLREDEAIETARRAIKLYEATGRKEEVRDMLRGLYKEADNLEWNKRADAITEAIAVISGGKRIHGRELDIMDGFFQALQRKPIDSGSRWFDQQHTLSKRVRNFNAVTMLGWTTVTSFTDPVLPLIRSGNMKAWLTGLAEWGMNNNNYREMLRETGIAIENMVHERLVHAYGVDGSKLTTGFFNFTLLTPWTNMNREWAGAVGFNWFKAEQKNFLQYGKNSRSGKKAFRVLKRYGLEHLTKEGAKQIDTIADLKNNTALKSAIIRFANETIFTPNVNDIPLWGQHPVGAMVMQLKMFPMMMGRMTFGKNQTPGVLTKEIFVKEGRRFAPLAMLLGAGPIFGAGAIGAKDILQFRGGEGETEAALRDRSLEHWENLLKIGGYDPEIHGDESTFMGWYLEGLVHLGGLGLVAELIHNAVAWADNGSYGTQVLASQVFGPTAGNAMAVYNTLQGGVAGAMGKETKGQQRMGMREIYRRAPVLGGIRGLREWAVDKFPGESPDTGGGSGWGAAFGSSFGNKNF